MSSLYQIDQEILSCLDFETGEIIDPEKLEALQMERSRKIENVACWIKNLKSDALALKAEKDAFAERESKTNKKIEQLEKWLLDALGGTEFSTAKCAVSFRRSNKVEVVDLSLIPAEFLRVKTTYEPDKKTIASVLKDGQEVGGCRLVESQNVQIK